MNVLILGASARAAALSALRAGHVPWCADLFADADLERLATVHKVPTERYPHGFLDALRHAPPSPVLYVGALENWPGLIAKIDRPMLGNPAEVLRAVRSPVRWTACLRSAGLPCPRIADGPVVGGQWLLKPRKSAGGLHIEIFRRQSFNPRTHLLQERIAGDPCSAVYVGDGADAELIGVTRQLIGTPWLNATGFHYAGNIGPLPLSSEMQTAWQRLGTALAREFRLRGLFGIDAIVGDGAVWPVEINPRYTASVELLERATGRPLLASHIAAFAKVDERNRVAENREPRTENERAVLGSRLPGYPVVHGKAIYYACANLTFPKHGPWLAALEPGADFTTIEFADIPHVGEIIEQGRPVLTIFASSATVEECEARLREKAQALDRWLWRQ